MKLKTTKGLKSKCTCSGVLLSGYGITHFLHAVNCPLRKRSNNKTLKNKCDALWASLIRARGKCQRCGGKNNLQAAHIFSRKYSHIRHDLKNGLCLDSSCHFWSHANPTEFTYWVESLIGRGAIDELAEKRLLTSKVDYNEVLRELTEKQDSTIS